MRLRPLVLLCALAVLPLTFASPVRAEMEPKGKDFDQEAMALFAASMKNNSGLVFYVEGQAIPGVVIESFKDAVVVKNQSHGRIVIRRNAISAIAGP